MVHLLILLLNPLLGNINTILLFRLINLIYRFIIIQSLLNHQHNITFFIILKKKSFFNIFRKITVYNQIMVGHINFKDLRTNILHQFLVVFHNNLSMFKGQYLFYLFKTAVLPIKVHLS